MIRKSFIFLPGISHKKERKIWSEGINDWQDFLRVDKINGISDKIKPFYDKSIKITMQAYFENDMKKLSKIFPKNEHWRLYNEYKEEAIYIDIETEGTNTNSEITTIGLFDGYETKTMIKGINMDYEKLGQILKNYKLIVSFNGTVFDIPTIRKKQDIIPEVPHFDLRFACQKIGLKGGLKKIEKDLGINRRKIIGNLNGGDAITLYRMYKGSGDDYYLNLLIEYNEEDIINLKQIADHTYKKLEQIYLAQ